MRFFHCLSLSKGLRSTKAKVAAVVVPCVVAALVPTVAAAEALPIVSDGAQEANGCGSVGKAADDGGDISSLTGLVYENVRISDCDSIMHSDMQHDCTNRSRHVIALCQAIASAAFATVSLIDHAIRLVKKIGAIASNILKLW